VRHSAAPQHFTRAIADSAKLTHHFGRFVELCEAKYWAVRLG
jgi:hypothetical protein